MENNEEKLLDEEIKKIHEMRKNQKERSLGMEYYIANCQYKKQKINFYIDAMDLSDALFKVRVRGKAIFIESGIERETWQEDNFAISLKRQE